MSPEYHIPYFTQKELACKATGGLLLATGFAENLVTLREKYAKPMIVTSCCRSRVYNQEIGGNPNSFHIFDYPRHGFLGTCAIDIAVTDLRHRGHLMSLAWSLGWSIGLNKNFLHLDRRIDYTNLDQVVFLY